eukprot:scaffold577031_cov15-Prasinocladus_malaysianus.AAC.1
MSLSAISPSPASSGNIAQVLAGSDVLCFSSICHRLLRFSYADENRKLFFRNLNPRRTNGCHETGA